MDKKELKQFFVFCHTHYEFQDVWHKENGDKGVFFEGFHDNFGGNEKYNPSKLPIEQQPKYKYRVSFEELLEVWQKVRLNLFNN